MLPGRQSVADSQMHQTSLEVSGGQQDEPGLALSPDGPGASPEPPSVSHTPDGNAAADTLASDMLRKLAGTTGCCNLFALTHTFVLVCGNHYDNCLLAL